MLVLTKNVLSIRAKQQEQLISNNWNSLKNKGLYY